MRRSHAERGNRAVGDEQSLSVVIYPLAPATGYGTIYGIGLTGVTQQIVIAASADFSTPGDFRLFDRLVGSFSVPGAVRFMLGCAACRDPLDRIERNRNIGGAHGFSR